MAQSSSRSTLTPEEFAKQLGGSVIGPAATAATPVTPPDPAAWVVPTDESWAVDDRFADYMIQSFERLAQNRAPDWSDAQRANAARRAEQWRQRKADRAQTKATRPGAQGPQRTGDVSLDAGPAAPASAAGDPATFARQLGGTVGPAPAALPAAGRQASLREPPTLGRTLYAAIPSVTATLGAGLAAAPFVLGAPFTGGASSFAAPTAGLVGAGSGAIVGRGIQWLIDRILDRPADLQNPQSAGDEATRQMMFEVAGHAVAAPVRMLRGSATPLTSDAADRLATSREFDLRLSTPEITGGSVGTMLQSTIGSRGISGRAIQQRARAQSRDKAARAVTSILDGVAPATSTTEAGALAKDTLGDATSTAARSVEDSITTRLAPAAGRTATGEKRRLQASVPAAARSRSKADSCRRSSPTARTSTSNR